ncbi:MAG: carbohydrate kinase family protein [Bdellovibrionales bacterium]|nr:carbohydrate kinase family protein [Bdellovibrionales bacterium]
MNNHPSKALCIVGLAYLEAYVPPDLPTPVPGTEVFVPDIQLSIGGALNSAVVANAIGRNCTIACPLGGGLADAAVRYRISMPDGLNSLTWEGPDNPALSLVYGSTHDRAFISKACWSALESCPCLDRFDWIHVAGLPEAMHLEPQLNSAVIAGAKVSVSASWQPDLLRKLASRTDSFWDVLFLNELEAGFSSSINNSTEAYKSCAKVIVTTLGKAGAHAVVNSEEQEFSAPSLTSNIVNVTGAGDAFAAGFIAACIEDLGIQTSLEWGNRAAAFYISLNDEERLKLTNSFRSRILE